MGKRPSLALAIFLFNTVRHLKKEKKIYAILHSFLNTLHLMVSFLWRGSFKITNRLLPHALWLHTMREGNCINPSPNIEGGRAIFTYRSRSRILVRAFNAEVSCFCGQWGLEMPYRHSRESYRWMFREVETQNCEIICIYTLIKSACGMRDRSPFTTFKTITRTLLDDP